jgi:hypothetical protein
MIRVEETAEFQNKYAHSADGTVIYIGEAASGRRGYFCMGCTNPMQAVHSDRENRQSYFRHDANLIKHNNKCTYSDESYRHKLAKEALQQSKRIKVPAIYKFPIDGKGKGMLIREAEFVEAYRVRNEVQFFEDDQGNVRWGGNGDQQKHLLIKPDVVFFDKEDKPFLFIELVATHKPDLDKRLKLLRLGIDTVSVFLPKDSPEAIADVFNISTRTKWVYNNLYESTEYISVADGDPEGVSVVDEEQRLLFAESFKCRSAQIGNLIRRITMCLESESYRISKAQLKSELSRVEGNTEELRRRLESQSNEYRRGIELREADSEAGFVRTRGDNQSVIDELESKYRDLESRYIAKATESERETAVYEAQIQRTIAGNGGNGKDFERRKQDYINKRADIDRSIQAARERIEGVVEERSGLDQRFADLGDETTARIEFVKEGARRSIESEQAKRSQLPGRYEKLKTELVETEGKLKRADQEELGRSEELRDSVPERFRHKEADLEREYDQLRGSTVRGIEEKDYQRNSYLSDGYKRVVSGTEQLHDAIKVQRNNSRSRAIKEFLTKGTYKAWI